MAKSALQCETKKTEICSQQEIYEKLIRESEIVPSDNTNLFSNNITNEDVKYIIEHHNVNVVQKSEEAYIEIVRDVVNKSGNNLNKLREDKTELRNKFVNLFRLVLIAQLIVLFAIFMINGFVASFNISDNIVMTYMTTVFIETLGVITLMITFAFKSSEEIKIIDILNSVVENYQKYGNKKSGIEKHNGKNE